MKVMQRSQAFSVRRGFRAVLFGTAAWTALATSGTAFAQSRAADPQEAPAQPEAAEADDAQSDVPIEMQEILVTGTKQSRAQEVQKVPVTISAFNGAQIEALKITNIQNVAYSIPNVSFESPGSMKGTANFTIRGLGVNSSLSSSAPTTGLFQNGMYMGINHGILVDTFDLDGLEVLRGPQGTLFGKNVTGGAVLINWRKPRPDADLNIRARLESGPEYSLAAAGGGRIVGDLSGRVAVLWRKDVGYFSNPTLNRKNFGRDEVVSVRPSLRYANGTTDITIFTEYGHQTGDGPATTAPDYQGATSAMPGAVLFPAYGYKYDKVYINTGGFTDLTWKSATLNATQEVGFGEDGQIALIAGYRDFKGVTVNDSDGTPLNLNANGQTTQQKQHSGELRYNGGFGPLRVTLGAFYFEQRYSQIGTQISINSTQGGKIHEKTFALFGQLDFSVTDRLLLQLGGRWNDEYKRGQIAPLASENPAIVQPGTTGTPGACSQARATCTYKFDLNETWKRFTPKVGLQYRASDDVQFYASWQKAARSGGYSVRYNALAAPRAYDEELQTAWEVGFKADLFDRHTRFNGAVFHTNIKGLQRDITLFDGATLANVARTVNTADATTQGFELELIQRIVPGLSANFNLGYVDAKYTNILFDITSDGVVDGFDYRQKLPRVSPWTYAAGLVGTVKSRIGAFTARGTYSHRDASLFPDYNTGRRDGAVPMLPTMDVFDLQLQWESIDKMFSITAYGRNLTNQFGLSAFTPISYPGVKACACTVNEGRVIGIELGLAF
ncbi:MAG: TonB-dependent receptor [Sphingomonadales bacterium]|nr:MAG: TonB-dependent receptor [Sphingomonadales bacterium]